MGIQDAWRGDSGEVCTKAHGPAVARRPVTRSRSRGLAAILQTTAHLPADAFH